MKSLFRVEIGPPGLALALLLNALASCATAESLFDLGDRYFETFGEQEGLRADIVMDIQQDSAGFIWLGTQGGLVRYDGYEFKSYTVDEEDQSSISGNYIRTMAIAGDELWAGTNADGISIYDPMSDSFLRLQNDPENEQSLADNDVWSLVSNGAVVIAATRTGLTLFRLEDRQAVRVKEIRGCEFLLEKGRLASVYLRKDRLFIGSFFGLCSVDIDEQSIFSSAWVGKEYADFTDQRVFDLNLVRDSDLWVTTRNRGIAVVNTETDATRWIPVDRNDPAALSAAWVDDTALIEGDIWAAMVGGGVAIIDAQTLVVKERIVHQPANANGLSLNDVSAVFKDDTGIVWLGTWGAGLNRYNPANSAFKILRQNPYDANSLGDSHIQSVKEMQNGDVWLGTATSGVQVVRPGDGLIRRYPAADGQAGAIQNPFIHSIEQLPSGEIWVGTNQTGVYRYNEQTDDFTRFTTEQGLTDDLVRTMFATDDGTLWLGTDAGLTRVEPESGYLEGVAIEGSGEILDKLVGTITSYEDDLWVGTSDGLYVIPGGTGALKPVSTDSLAPLADNYISDLFVDSRGWLWVSTSQGVDVLERWDGEVASFRSVNEALGLPPGNLGGAIEEDGRGRMWIQSLLVDPSDWSFTRINRSDGWDVGNTWIGSNARLRDGTIAFGGTRGLMMVRPEEFQQVDSPARVVVTRGVIDSKPLALAQMSPMVLPADVKSFSVEFAALNYASSQQMRYRYKLEGYDDDWITTSPKNRRATYSKLSPGEYTLRMGSSPGDGLGFSSVSIPVTQLPHWYETGVFQAVAAMLAMASLYLLYRLRVQSLYRQKLALDALVEQRTLNIRQLAEAGQDITASLNLDRVVDSIYRHVAELMAADVFAVGLLDSASETLDVRFHFQDGRRIEGVSRELSNEASAAAWCVKNRRVLNVGNEHELREISPRLRLTERPSRMQSLIFHPLIVDDKTIGFLSLQSYSADAYGENEQQMLKTITAYAAGAIDNAESLRKLNETKAQIERVSLTDQLTGLSNRRFLDSFMPGEINRIQRLIAQGSAERLGLVLVDVDHFKQVNDSYGHSVGDRVLIQLAEILKATCREMDWAVRLGGEEFLVVSRVNNRDQLLGLAERFRKNVEAHRFDIGPHKPLQKTCSIGICTFPFISGDVSAVSWERTISIADEALYMAKREGRNRWVALFETEPKTEGEDVNRIPNVSNDDFATLISSGEVVAVRSSDS
ncbi:MAG: diguanylate cyclase [Pseudomonadota bacterium]